MSTSWFLMGMHEGKMTLGMPLISNDGYLDIPRWYRWCFNLSIALICTYVADKLEEIDA